MTYQAMDRTDEARAAFVRAEAVLAAAVAEQPEAGNTRAAHAIALAGVGRHQEARDQLERSFTLYPASKDPWIMTWRWWDQAYIQLLSGDHEAAVKTLARLVAHPSDIISPAMLQHSPFFDDLRGRDDFQALLAAQS
jgi:Flp pilus assembly protein TadD